MKIRINKTTLAQMPEQVRVLVQDWKARYRKATIDVETRDSFPAMEDARVTIINLLTDAKQTERVGGEWAGVKKLSPTANIPLPIGCVAVVTGIFCGLPWLTIYQGGATQITNGK